MKPLKQIKANEAKKQKVGFFRMLIGILVAILLGNLLTGKGAIVTSQERSTIRASKGKSLAGQDFQCHLIL